MKIIYKGHIPAEKTYRVTCTNCKTVFEFQRNEAESYYDQRGNISWLTIGCPVCTKYVHVPR